MKPTNSTKKNLLIQFWEAACERGLGSPRVSRRWGWGWGWPRTQRGGDCLCARQGSWADQISPISFTLVSTSLRRLK